MAQDVKGGINRDVTANKGISDLGFQVWDVLGEAIRRHRLEERQSLGANLVTCYRESRNAQLTAKVGRVKLGAIPEFRNVAKQAQRFGCTSDQQWHVG